MKTQEDINRRACDYARAEFSHAGDLGDIIWGVAALRLWLELAGIERATLWLYHEANKTTHVMTESRANLIIPLLNAQGWLDTRHSPEPIDSDFDGWRAHMADWGTIGGAHCGAIGLTNGAHTAALERPWLKVPVSVKPLAPKGGVVFARTSRYLSHDFPWKDIINWFGSDAVFLGTSQEHSDFVRLCPAAARVPHLATKNLLEAAEVIDGCRLFVGNQSSLYAIADGLKKPRVLESFIPCANCQYGSRNALPIRPGATVTQDRILELLTAPHTV